MKRSLIFQISIAAGLMSCSFHFTPTLTSTEHIAVLPGQPCTAADSMANRIAPYRAATDSIMNRQISYCAVNLDHFRGRSPMALLLLNQLDVIAHKQFPEIGNDGVMIVLNSGGIRSGLQQGIVNVGSVYRLLPFDNRLVYLRLTEKEQEAILLQNRANQKLLFGGDTIAGTTENEHTWLVSSDFVMNGGDLFKLPPGVDRSRVINSDLLRDLILQQFTQIDTIKPVK